MLSDHHTEVDNLVKSKMGLLSVCVREQQKKNVEKDSDCMFNDQSSFINLFRSILIKFLIE